MGNYVTCENNDCRNHDLCKDMYNEKDVSLSYYL